MEYTVHGNKHGWGDLFIEIKLGFAGWINVFFCSTGGESVRRFGMSVTTRDSTTSLKPSAQVNTKIRKDPTAKHHRNPIHDNNFKHRRVTTSVKALPLYNTSCDARSSVNG